MNLIIAEKSYLGWLSFIIITVVWTLIILITGCQSNSSVLLSPATSQFNSAIPTPSLPSRPNYGKASVIGRVLTYSGKPLIGVPVRLAKVYNQGKEKIFLLEGGFSPGGVTQDDGYFVIENIEPGEYVIVVGNPENVYEIISEAPGKAKVWNFVANEIANVGAIRVRLQP